MVSLVPGVIGLWVAFVIEEYLGCHGCEHCVSNVLIGSLGLLLRKIHRFGVFCNGVLFVMVLVHIILEGQAADLTVARCILLQVEMIITVALHMYIGGPSQGG